jgi:hypothetical protein
MDVEAELEICPADWELMQARRRLEGTARPLQSTDRILSDWLSREGQPSAEESVAEYEQLAHRSTGETREYWERHKRNAIEGTEEFMLRGYDSDD